MDKFTYMVPEPKRSDPKQANPMHGVVSTRILRRNVGFAQGHYLITTRSSESSSRSFGEPLVRIRA